MKIALKVLIILISILIYLGICNFYSINLFPNLPVIDRPDTAGLSGTDTTGNSSESDSQVLIPVVTHVPVVGAVTSNSARFVIRTDNSASIRLILSSDSSAWSNPIFSNQVQSQAATDYFVLLEVSGLSPNTVYYYRPELDGLTNSYPAGRFKTFPVKGEAATFSFLTGSCQQAFDDPLSNIGNIFPLMAEEDALFLLHQGDWTYPDTTDGEAGDSLDYFAKHFDLIYDSYKTRYDANFPMADLLRVKPVDYLWDDHDWVNNNSDKTFLLQGGENSIQVYQEAFPHYPLPAASNGIWHKFSCGNADFFVVDNRVGRDPNLNAFTLLDDKVEFNANYLDNHTILGELQMNWLLTELITSQATWKFISSGTPFNPAVRALMEIVILLQGNDNYDPLLEPVSGNTISMKSLAVEFADKWCGFPASVVKLLSGIIVNDVKNVIFLSGDTHTSGIDDGINSVIPELMAGPLDRINQQLAAVAKKNFQTDIWNKGGHTYDNALPPDLGNAYGKVSIFEDDSVVLEIISEKQNILASHSVKAGFLPRRRAGVIVPDGINFGQVSQNGLGGAALMAINTSIDTFKIFSISVERIEGNSQVVALNQSASLEPGGVKPLLFGFFPGGTGTDTTRAIITIQTNDPYNSEKTFAVEGIVIPTAVVEDEPANMIKTYELLQNYPNPFNPVTTISYFLPKMQHVSLKVYDLLGREIKTLVDGYKMAGQHEEIFDAENLSSGMYIYKLETDEFYMMKKMVYVR